MVDEGTFFQKKFIDYYNIDMHSIEQLLLNELKSSEIIALSLSDCESQIILSSTGDEKFHQETTKNNNIVSIITKSIKSFATKEEFIDLEVTTHSHIEISKHIFWKRNLLLYIIFDVEKTNLALANNKVVNSIKNIKNILNNNS